MILFCHLAAGVSLPVGKFADKSVQSDTNSKATGWAKPGIVVGLALHYKVNRFAGIIVKGGYWRRKQELSQQDFPIAILTKC
jgi:hypothetical protein